MRADSLPVRLLHRLVAHPAVYNLVQRLAGAEENRRRLRGVLGGVSGVLLDVGAGTGNYVDLLPSGARYLWLDNDTQKLAGFRRRTSGQWAILADAGRLPIRDGSVDYAISVAVSHHLSDDELDVFLGSLANVCRQGFIFLDALDRPESLVSRLLWRYDRGSNPRNAERLREFLGRYFHIESEQQYRVHHTYLLCVARPLSRRRSEQ